MKVIGIDIGGTKTIIGIVDIKKGKVIKKISIPSKQFKNDKENLKSIVANTIDIIGKLNIKKVGIGILAADCAPILLYDPQKKIIGCIHSGWKGALNKIIENTIDKFLELNSDTRDLVAVIGPCIDHHHYEVGDDFYKKFLTQSKNNEQFFIISDDKKYLFNIRSYISEKLVRLGIKNIDHIKMDTFSDKENFFSYRRSKGNNDKDYGRCISVIIMA